MGSVGTNIGFVGTNMEAVNDQYWLLWDQEGAYRNQYRHQDQYGSVEINMEPVVDQYGSIGRYQYGTNISLIWGL